MINQRMPQTQKFFKARVTVRRNSETIIPHRIDLKESQFVNIAKYTREKKLKEQKLIFLCNLWMEINPHTSNESYGCPLSFAIWQVDLHQQVTE